MRLPRVRPADLPDFARPPVTEVVLSIQFAPLLAFKSVHVGLLWERFRKEYPKVSEQAQLAPAFETFGGAAAVMPPMLEIQTLLSPPMSRFWFETADGYELMQVQQDRIVHNWRKREREQEYPRYESIRDKFSSDVENFAAFLESEKLGAVSANQCEVGYINTIELSEGADPHKELNRITPLWTGQFAERYNPELENSTIQSRFVLREGGRPYGRVYVSFAPAFLTADNRPVVRLEITVRGRPSADSIDNAFEMLDDQRELVVRTFAAVTTPEMWKIWGRADAK